MLRNYIKIAWRNISKNKFYSMVNIVGLSAGIAFTVLIAAYVWGELRVNKDLKNADRQYVIQSKWRDPNQGYGIASFGPLARALKESYPDLVANYYRYDGITSNVSRADKSFRENIQVCDSTLLTMYGFKLIDGNPRTAFDGPYSVVITQETAKKYFGRINVVGETLNIGNFSGSKHDFEIKGVLAPIAKNSATELVDEYPGKFFISINNLPYFGRNMEWNNTAIAGYIELKPGVNPAALAQPIKDLVRRHAPEFAADVTPFIVSLDEYYLVANNGLVKKMIYALSAIALFILGMAIINFVNMSVSRSATRMREIGIRKVLGGLKKQLIVQFLVESTILVFIATTIGFCIFILTRDLFSGIVGKEIPSLLDFPIYFISFPLMLILLTGIVAGIYPAFVLSSLRSVDSLKGKLSTVKENVLLRKLLVAFQFGTATIVFVGAIIISRQINLFFSKDLGYDKDMIIAAQVPRDWSQEGVNHMESIRKEFESMNEIEQATLSYEVPDGNNSGNSLLYRAGADSSLAKPSQILYTDEYYADTYRIPMAAGEFFAAPGAYTDSSKLVINEAQAKSLGWKNASEAIGGQIRFPGVSSIFTVAGVTKDFHFGSMQSAIQAITFVHVGSSRTFRFFSFKLRAGNIGNSLQQVQQKWSALLPGAPFEYRFMDETLSRLYKTEIQLKKASYVATVLSLLIVLLGVVGLVSLSVQKRTKEIGIRKVLGATISSIIALFMREFLLVVLFAGIIACPVAWFIMNGWLNDYAYRIALNLSPFAIAITGLLGVTGVLILIQTLRAGIANPVKSLRSE